MTLEVIGDGDAAVEQALAGANVLALMASMVHLTGDLSALHGDLRPRRFVFNHFDGGLSPEQQHDVRRAVLPVVLAYRDAGSVPPPPPAAPVVRELMDALAAERVPEEYVELFAEEMDLAGDDRRRFIVSAPNELSVLVIGCGMSGLLAGIRLKQAGIPFEIVEKNDDVGGTWYENTYPGCRVDVPNHYYCYSFAPHDFGEHFARQSDLHDYFRRVMRERGIEPHVRWRTEVEQLEWDDGTGQWRATMRAAQGGTRQASFAAVISAVGQLNRPLVPDFPNLDRFSGPLFHSARWDHSVDLRGKRVAVIGAGASGFQIAPAIADDVNHLVVVQRTAQWMLPNLLYHQAMEPGARWAMRHLPGYERWYRYLLLWQATDKMLEVARVGPEWAGLPHSANAASERFRQRILRWIDQQVGDDPDLRAQVIPDYPPLGKRLLQDDGTWLRTLARPDVELVRGGVDDIEAGAVVAAGRRYPVDVIILATGFRANDFLFPMDVTGRHGVKLRDAWNGQPSAYLGITVPQFPNLFLLYGPGTNLAHTGSIIFHSECQLRYVGGCLSQLADAGAGAAIEPRVEAFNRYRQRWQEQQAQMVWSHPSVGHSWYKAADGHVYVLSPWRLVDYWAMTAAPDPDDHVVMRKGGVR